MHGVALAQRAGAVGGGEALDARHGVRVADGAVAAGAADAEVWSEVGPQVVAHVWGRGVHAQVEHAHVHVQAHAVLRAEPAVRTRLPNLRTDLGVELAA
ncbi:MAG: hypothetical protein KC668_20005, partial [Myxococcales bacterium]|nr:hypothetical protein [Myxococcales bacterium]